ncbi:hypothetical protein HRbin19_01348 [bacterium HR19]|nr:hypothetical protein HRbin19_01348 [bacterium HR19]
MEIKIEGIREEEAKKISELFKKIAENKDSIETVLDVIEKLRETGLLAAISALAEGAEEGFNSVAKPELMASIANAMIVFWMLGNMSHPMLFEVAQKLPYALNKSFEEIKKIKEEGKEKPSLFKIFKMIKSQEFYYALKLIHSILTHLH